jgi:hypothetical protein
VAVWTWKRGVGAILAALAVGGCSPAAFEPSVRGVPRAVPLARSHDFGEVAPGTRVEHRFEIANRGDRVLELKPVGTSCGCSASLAGADTVFPGETGSLTASLDAGDGAGAKTAWIRVQTNDPIEPEIQLLLHGRVAGDVRVAKPRLYLGRVDADESRTVSVDVELTAPTVEISSVRASSERLKVVADRLAPPARGVRLNVTLPPQGARGRINDRILVATTSKLQPEVEIEVLASVE